MIVDLTVNIVIINRYHQTRIILHFLYYCFKRYFTTLKILIYKICSYLLIQFFFRRRKVQAVKKNPQVQNKKNVRNFIIILIFTRQYGVR